MPELMSQIDVYFVEIIIKLQLYGEQPDSGKIRILLDLRLNIHGNPEVAAMLLQNWDIILEMKKIIDRYVKFSGNNFSHYYFWTGIAYFREFFQNEISAEEIDDLRRHGSGDTAYKNPDFLSNLSDFNHNLSLKKKLTNRKNVEGLKNSIFILIFASSAGGNFDYGMLRSCIRNEDDLKLLAGFCINLFRKKIVIPYYFLKHISDWKDIYFRDSLNTLKALESIFVPAEHHIPLVNSYLL